MDHREEAHSPQSLQTVTRPSGVFLVDGDRVIPQHIAR